MEAYKTEFEPTQDHLTIVDAGRAPEMERVAKDNRKYFDEVLVKHPKSGAFFQRFEDWRWMQKLIRMDRHRSSKLHQRVSSPSTTLDSSL